MSWVQDLRRRSGTRKGPGRFGHGLSFKPEGGNSPAVRRQEDLGADSANVMVLIMEVEDQFGIMVEDDAIMTLKTVDDVVKYIDSRA